MRTKSIFFGIIFVTTILSGCTIKSWEVEEFVVKDGPPAGYIGESVVQFPDFTVSRVVFQVKLRGTGRGQYESHAPFTLHVSAWKEQNKTCTARILGISIADSSGSNYSITHTNDFPAALPFNEILFPETGRKIDVAH